MSKQFYITEVFSEQAYGGNQLATLPDSGDLDGGEMQKIARAFNFAETTFICGGSLEAGFDVRIFTPNSELPFAGHPTLGTSYVIRDHLLQSSASQIVLNLGIGPIPVKFGDDGVLWMSQNEPVFGEVFSAAEIAIDLDVSLEDIDTRYPCQRVSTGLEFVIVPLKSYAALQTARVVSGVLSRGCLVFCEGEYDSGQQIQARMFAGGLGVPEDPATGSANGCLAAYLSKYRRFGSSEVDTRVGQGYEISRPSQLYLRANPIQSDYRIEVGGRVRLIAEGQWLI
jgi:trans-2,3-dihydro-3-hydroxyanthranilate isomerase